MPATCEEATIAKTAAVEAAAPSCTAQINSHLLSLKQAHTLNDRRLVSRVLLNLPTIRRKLTAKLLLSLVKELGGTIFQILNY